MPPVHETNIDPSLLSNYTASALPNGITTSATTSANTLPGSSQQGTSGPSTITLTVSGDGSNALNRNGATSTMSSQEQEMHQKDQELAQFLLKMDAYQPLIPDEVTTYFLERSGCAVNDVRVKRLLSLACQKFISDVAQDAFSYARTRASQAPGGRQVVPNSSAAAGSASTGQAGASGGGQGVNSQSSAATGAATSGGGGGSNAFSGQSKKDRAKTVLTQEDLAQALAEYGINAARAPYYL